jgi:hydrocephalus-inducing protein
LINQE